MSEIISRLWIGDKHDSQNWDFIKNNNINLIINVTKHLPNLFIRKNIEYLRFPINDPGPNLDENQMDVKYMINNYDIFLFYLRNQHSLGKKILIHCNSGNQRSVTLVLLYLISINKFTKPIDKFNDSLNIILSKRPSSFYNGTKINFKPVVIDILQSYNI